MTKMVDRKADGALIYRQPRAVRIWHWTNALTLLVMLMSGLMIFNAHPRLYWGHYGANYDPAWFEIGAAADAGFLRLGALTIRTTGVLGLIGDDARAFPSLITLPSRYDLAGARQWHLAFSWLLVISAALYWLWSFASRHVQRDLAPSRKELAPRSLWRDLKDHALLRFPTGEAALRYNVLQKISYLVVIFGLLPAMIFSGLTLSPGMNAALPWLVDLFGGRQSARSIHFICAMLLVLFFIVHIAMVLLAGPYNELRSIITGWCRLPGERAR